MMKEINDGVYFEPGAGLVYRLIGPERESLITRNGIEQRLYHARARHEDTEELESAWESMIRIERTYRHLSGLKTNLS